MGPGILMASAAVGGSHIVSSTQAGGSYGWALLGLVILANLFKYPFFRFGAEYTADTGKTLVEGYAEKGKFYLWVFFILNVFSALVNTAGVSILCSAIIASAFPMLGLSITTWSIILVAIIWGTQAVNCLQDGFCRALRCMRSLRLHRDIPWMCGCDDSP